MQKILLISSFLFCATQVFSQSVGIGITIPSDKAILDLTSTTKGLFIPRMTTVQRGLILGLGIAQKGLMIYNTDANAPQYWDGVGWLNVGIAAADNLGNHLATSTLNMGGHMINNVTEIYNNGWFRTWGNSGFYSQSYGGGWNMVDFTWLRTYGDKPILASGGIAGYGNDVFGAPYGMNPQMYANYNSVVGGGIMVGNDGGFGDFNDGWIQFRGSTGFQVRSNNTTWAMQVHVGDVNGVGTFDKRLSPSQTGWGSVGNPGNVWWQMHSYSFTDASERKLKKDITKVDGGVRDLVMKDLDKLEAYLYRYNVETDEMKQGMESKYRPGLHLGLIVDETPDYIQASSFDGVDIYAAATLGIAAAKYNRDDIRKIKDAMGFKENSIIIQDLGSIKTRGKEIFVAFDADFAKSLNGNIPVVTLSTSVKAADLTVEDKSDKGFKVVVNGDAMDVVFDYIVMAKVRLPENTTQAVPDEVIKRMYVDESVKSQIKEYWKRQPDELKKSEEQKSKEAILIQQERQKEVEVKVEMIEKQEKKDL